MVRRNLLRVACFLLLLAAPSNIRAASVVDEVPDDALGFIHIHNLSSVDEKIGQLTTALQRNIPRPLAFLQAFAGIGDGLDTNGDALLALFPAAGGNDDSMQFCIWLPITDYKTFLNSIHATSIDGVAATSIGGEDLLVANHGNWALIMDPDQRDRITKLAAGATSPAPIRSWMDWINTNDVSIIVLESGVHSVLNRMFDDELDQAELNEPADDGFPQRSRNAARSAPSRPIRSPADLFENGKTELTKWLTAAPELADALQQANTVGAGIRLDNNGNAVTKLRVSVDKELTEELVKNNASRTRTLPYSLYDSGSFVLNAAGSLPSQITSAYAKAYVRRVAADLKNDERTQLDETAFRRLIDAVGLAAADVESAVALSQPGEQPQPIYSNEFVALRVTSAPAFVEHSREAMRLWNSASRSAKGETKLVFDVEETKVGELPATLYSLDVGALDGGVVIPEIRQIMEQLFGPGGKLRLWIVPIDDKTVLLASATPDQMIGITKVLAQKKPVSWESGDLAEVNALLPAESDWRASVDPHRYFDWKRRESTAVIGVPVIGGPLVRDFPAAPPIAVAGGLREGEVWLEAAALAPTLKSAATYLTRSPVRGRIQLRVQPPAVQPAPVPNPQP